MNSITIADSGRRRSTIVGDQTPSGAATPLTTSACGINSTNSPAPSSEPPQEYSIRLTPYIDHNSSTPALYFPSIERRCPPGTRIKIGRHNDKNITPNTPPEQLPITFKSKVVSRVHAELYVNDSGSWFITDTKSSSGTFLNYTRLSPAGETSDPHLLRDGDLLQLGMDFRGGTEDIYKCVRMRIEINRSWQRKVNKFNVSALKKIGKLTTKPIEECTICLLDVTPCQPLFVAPCSHLWHYKCVRPLIIRSYPQFLCPNCRALCDLEADLEEIDHDVIFSEEEAPEAEDGQGNQLGNSNSAPKMTAQGTLMSLSEMGESLDAVGQ